ncbi:MAG: hypothetical protein ACKOXK_08040 [Chakrabartia sp.]
MTNLIIILLLGGSLGWIYTARNAGFGSGEAIINILVAMVASMAGARVAQSSLYNGLTGESFAYSIALVLIALGALGLLRQRIAR